jgi:copper chaperone CopZ
MLWICKNQQGDMKPMEYYVHHVPGRLRVRIPALRRNPGRAADVEGLLDIEGVDSLSVSHLTGSVVVTFNDDRVSTGRLLGILKENGYYDGSRRITCDDKIRRASGRAAAKVGRAVFGYALGKTLEANGLSLLAALI